jgi:transposase
MKSDPRLESFAAFIGIDWADEQHEICLAEAGCERLERRSLEQNPEAINEWVAELRRRFQGRPIAVAVEQTRGGLVHALMQHEFLVLYLINPSTSAQFRAAWKPSRAKDDITDAELLLELVRLHRDRLRPWYSEDVSTRKLLLLCEHRRKAVSLRVRLTNQLRSALKSYYPLACTVCGDKLNSPMALRFLAKWPTMDALQHARPQTLRQFYYRLNSRYPKTIELRLNKILTAEPLTTDVAIIDAYTQQMLLLVDQLAVLQKHIARYEQVIQALFVEHPDASIFQSFPGSGSTYAPRLLSAFGTDRERFDSAAAVQSLCGIAPVVERSGKSVWIHRRWGCLRFARQSFHEWAAESIRHSIWARAWYATARERGMGHHAAVRALAFKWIRIMYRCWQDRKPYDELAYLTALKRRESPLWDVIHEHPEAVKISA